MQRESRWLSTTQSGTAIPVPMIRAVFIYVPLKLGDRFSRNARTPSPWSSEEMAWPWAKASSSRAAARSVVVARLSSDLASASVPGGPAAILAASVRVVASSSATGTTRLTRPIRSASAASMMSAVNTSSLALASPTSRGRSQVPPPSGTRPILAKTSPKRARSEAITRSQPSAILQPAPTAKPSTMASVGLGKLKSRSTKRFNVATRAEVAARAGENDGAHRLIGLQLVEGAHQLLAHPHVDGVPRLGAVERHGPDALDPVHQNRLVAHLFPSGQRLRRLQPAAARGPPRLVDREREPRRDQQERAGGGEGCAVAAGQIEEEAREPGAERGPRLVRQEDQPEDGAHGEAAEDVARERGGHGQAARHAEPADGRHDEERRRIVDHEERGEGAGTEQVYRGQDGLAAPAVGDETEDHPTADARHAEKADRGRSRHGVKAVIGEHGHAVSREQAHGKAAVEEPARQEPEGGHAHRLADRGALERRRDTSAGGIGGNAVGLEAQALGAGLEDP